MITIEPQKLYHSPRVWLMAALVATLCVSQALNGQVAVNISDHRPLAAAVDVLEQNSGVPINYEDIPYQNQTDLEDVSTPQQRAQYPAYHLWVPRAGTITAALGAPSDNLSNINVLLDVYRNNNLPGDFSVEQENGMFYVIASKVLAAGGPLQSVSPMKTVVTVPYAKRTIADTIGVLLEAVFNSSGVRIQIGSLPFLPPESISYGSAQAMARDVLAEIFSSASKTLLAYRLLYDPLTGYMLNVQPLSYPTQPIVRQTATPTIQPTGPRPGLTKP